MELNKYPPVVEQPKQSPAPPALIGSMATVGIIPPPNCPPGLEYLSAIDKLLVHQKVEKLEMFLGFETKNKYTIMNAEGQIIYNAKEETDCCTRQCCGPMRPMDMEIRDNTGREVIHLNRPLNCQGCCCPCCLQVMEVYSPPGQLVGTVTEQWSFCKQIFHVNNAAGDVVLSIKGPVCVARCGDVNFKVYGSDGETIVGKITKQWSGLAREMFTDADHFGISFPRDLDVSIKAVLLGACFLIDMMYYERQNN